MFLGEIVTMSKPCLHHVLKARIVQVEYVELPLGVGEAPLHKQPNHCRVLQREESDQGAFEGIQAALLYWS